jgi:hypothetical protein
MSAAAVAEITAPATASDPHLRASWRSTACWGHRGERNSWANRFGLVVRTVATAGRDAGGQHDCPHVDHAIIPDAVGRVAKISPMTVACKRSPARSASRRTPPRERHRDEQPYVVGAWTVRDLHRRDDPEQREGRAETGTGSWAERATARRKNTHGYADQHA